MSYQENAVIHVQTTDLRIRVPKNAESNKVRSLNPLEREEIRAMIQVMLKNSPKEIRLMVGLGCQTGLRLGEAITFSDKLVRKPLAWENRIEVEIGPHVGVNTKFGKIRTVEIPATLMRALYNYSVSERRENRKVRAGDLGKHVPLFISQRYGRYTKKSVMKLWGDIRAIVRKVYGSPFNHDFHDTRVSYCTYRLQSLLDSGVSPADAISLLMGWMGHKNERDTWKYIKFLRTHEVRKEAMTMLDRLMDEALSSEE
jgi:integrase